VTVILYVFTYVVDVELMYIEEFVNVMKEGRDPEKESLIFKTNGISPGSASFSFGKV
jgi:hypothetical protein